MTTIDNPLGATRIQLFYSSTTEPAIVSQYEEEFEALRDAGIETEAIDITDSPDTARDHQIIATPTVLIHHDDTTTKITGLIGSLTQALQEDDD